jgi:antitoxin (DNA-binding transcriptional repressor) of toxin-antitoxin stability system
MKMLSVTEAQADLTAVLERARNGEDIGIISGNQVIQLKPVRVVSHEESYLFQEYGVTPAEWERFKKRQTRKFQTAQHQEKLKYFSGNLEKDIVD